MTQTGFNYLPLYTLAFVLVFLTTATAGTPEVSSVYVNAPITVDGNIDDWMELPGVMLDDQNASLGVSNDGECLYILFKTRDPRWMRTIRMTGLTLYLNNEGKKKKDYFIKFHDGPTRAQMRAMGDNRESDMPTRGMGPRSNRDSESEPRLTCYIKDRIIEKAIPLDGSEGPRAAFDTSHGFCAYEFSIPLAEDSVRFYGIGADPGRQIVVGLEWGDMEDAMKERMGGKDRGGMGGPGGGMGGPGVGMGGPGGGMGGPGGGMGGGRGGERPEMPEKQEVWIKAELGTPPATSTGEK